MPADSAANRVRNLLSLIPVLYANRGRPASEVLPVTGHKSVEELEDDLSAMMLIGVPPFQPQQLLDIYIDPEEKTIEVYSTLGLEKPLQFDIQEMLAIRKIIENDISYRTGSGLNSSDSAHILEKLSSIPVEYEQIPESGVLIDQIESAIEQNKQIQIDYSAATTIATDEPVMRTTDPYVIFRFQGNAYLVARDHSKNAVRNFRVDRIMNLKVLSEARTTQPGPGLKESLLQTFVFAETRTGIDVTFACHPDIERNLARFIDFSRAVASKSDFSYPVRWNCYRLNVPDSGWFAGIAKSFGNKIVVLSPQNLRDSVKASLEIDIPALLS